MTAPAAPQVPPAASSHEAWRRLWATGVTDTFGDNPQPGAGPAARPPLAEHWLGWLARHVPQGARVLDLGTGNGALPRWLLQACPTLPLHCDGVDVVPVHPAWVANLPAAQRAQLQFHAGVSAAQLPFESGRYDLVLSQYGLEYAGWPHALPEALRMLAPGGRLALALHHAASRPARLAHEEIRHAQWLLQSGWLDAATQMAQALSLLGSESGRQALAREPRWAAVRQQFDRWQQDLRELGDDSVCPDLLYDAQHWCTQAFRVSAEQGAGAGQAAMVRLSQQVQDTQARLQDLLAHVLDEAQFQTVCQQVAEAGLTVHEARSLHDGGHLMGWWLSAQRPGSALD